MKARAIRYENSLQKHFFLLMIAPLLIGLIISLTNFAHADWKKDEFPNPTKQGWKQIQTHQVSLAAQKGQRE